MNFFKKHWSELVSAFVGLVGIATTIVTSFEFKDNSFVFIVSMVFQLTLTMLIIWHMKIKYEYKSFAEDLEKSLKQKEQEFEQAKTENEKSRIEREDKYTKSINTIITNFKEASKLYNESCNTIPEISTSSYDTLDALKKSGITDQVLLEEQICKSKEAFANALFELYNRYTKEIIEYSIKAIDTHLKSLGNDIKLSATIKLLNRPYYDASGDRRGVAVYTAFRDKKSYNNDEREIGLSKYTIDGNADFIYCLKKEYFIINNAKKNSQNYMNEHADFDQYYNCAVVVPIRVRVSGSSYKFFGYLCCDCLNKDTNNKEIFSSESGKILFTMAQLYGTFLETLNSNWMDRTNGQDETKDSYLTQIYNAVFVGDGK